MSDPLGTVLAVFAHPDDETYLCGGLMARVARNGSRVVCVTATRGELGSTDEALWPPGEPLAAVRTKELEATLAELGVSEHHWLDYPDGGCVDVDQDEAVRRISEIMSDVSPDTVLTFGPDGQTGHPDHISASRWATAAFGQVAPSGSGLHYSTHTRAWLDTYRARLDELNVFMGAEPPCTAEDELSINEQLSGDLIETKVRAIRCMVSQAQPLIDALGEDYLREGMREEVFRLASGSVGVRA